MSTDLALDDEIRNWVVIPIALVVLLQGLLRHYLSVIFQSKPKRDAKQLRFSVQRTIGMKHVLPERAFLARQAAFCKDRTGLLEAVGQEQQSSGALLFDTSVVFELLKSHISLVVPQMLLIAWVNYYFSGMIVVQLPFMLPDRFRVVLQRGVMLPSLDTVYISSLSWYFICLFGLSGLQAVITGPTTQQQSSLGSAVAQFGLLGLLAGSSAGQDRVAEANRVRDVMQRTAHQSAAAKAEYRLLQRLRRKEVQDEQKSKSE